MLLIPLGMGEGLSWHSDHVAKVSMPKRATWAFEETEGHMNLKPRLQDVAS
jgi:hypothetical protein